jgi:hypothetical protein
MTKFAISYGCFAMRVGDPLNGLVNMITEQKRSDKR